MAILKQDKKTNKNGNAYNRTEAQRKQEDWSEYGDLERGYARSKMNSGPIEYNNTGTKI